MIKIALFLKRFAKEWGWLQFGGGPRSAQIMHTSHAKYKNEVQCAASIFLCSFLYNVILWLQITITLILGEYVACTRTIYYMCPKCVN